MTDAPRILQVVLALGAGGTERLVIELARRLNAEFPMAVCCLDEPGEWAGEVTAHGVSVTALARRPGFHPGMAGAIARAARSHRASIIHCHHYSPFVYGALSRLWKPGSKVIYTEHGRLSDAPPSFKRRLANSLLARAVSRAFAVSAELKGYIVDEGFSPRQVGVIYNGIDIGPLPTETTRREVRRELGVSPGTFVIGTIARLDPVKNLGALIRATSELSHQMSTTLVVVGDGPEGGSLKAIAAGLTPAPDVRFLGQRNDARRWLAGCDAYVNCSISEGVSLTILEAMAAGLPVLATSVGGTPEVVDAETGLLVPSRDQKALARELRTLATRPELRARLGWAGRRRVENRFTLDRMVREYRDVYRSIA